MQVHLQIARHGAVAAGVPVIADGVQDGLSGFRHLVRAQILLAKQAEDRSGGYRGQKLAFRVGPKIGGAGLQKHRAGRHQGHQHVRIHRGFLGVSGVFRIVGGELIGIARGRGQVGDGFAIVAPAQSGAASAAMLLDRVAEGRPGVGEVDEQPVRRQPSVLVQLGAALWVDRVPVP